MRHDWWLIRWASDHVPAAAFPTYAEAVQHVDARQMRGVEITRVSVTFGSSLMHSVGKGARWTPRDDDNP